MPAPAKKKWFVQLPIVGSISFEVEADSEEEAIDAALMMEASKGEESWEAVKHVTEGNVFNGELNDAYAEEIEDE